MNAREQIAEVLTHSSYCLDQLDVMHGRCSCLGSRLAIADALMPLVDRLRAEAAAEARKPFLDLATRFSWDTMREPDWTGQQVADAIRRAAEATQ